VVDLSCRDTTPLVAVQVVESSPIFFGFIEQVGVVTENDVGNLTVMYPSPGIWKLGVRVNFIVNAAPALLLSSTVVGMKSTTMAGEVIMDIVVTAVTRSWSIIVVPSAFIDWTPRGRVVPEVAGWVSSSMSDISPAL
jgi:hypothetical protein